MSKVRNKKITVRYTEDELQEAHGKSDGPLASWLRDLSLNQKEKKGRKVRYADPQLLYELNKLGVNLNQIARICNQSQNFNAGERLELLLVLSSIDEEIKSIRDHYDR